jgi:regulator of protease activity HflC (stomatin/prohibitin superfamily)
MASPETLFFEQTHILNHKKPKPIIMTFVRIKDTEVGLIYRDGQFRRLVGEGRHWCWPNEKVTRYSKAFPAHFGIDQNLLLQHEELANMLHLIEVGDEEIVLLYEEGNFQKVLTAGRHYFWKGLVNYRFITADLSKVEVTERISPRVLNSLDLRKYVRTFKVASFERAFLLVDGQMERELQPGTHYFWKNEMELSVEKADMRQQFMEVSGQELLTNDKAALRVNFNAQYRIKDPKKALLENKDHRAQLYLMLQLALRDYIGTLTLDQLLGRKETVAEKVRESAGAKAEVLGLELLDAGIRDIILPGEVKDIMNQVLIAQKQAQANVIMRREETASTRSLLNTARLMEENAMLYKLKEMEYVEKIADKINSISVSGGSQIVEQLKELFSPGDK